MARFLQLHSAVLVKTGVLRHRAGNAHCRTCRQSRVRNRSISIMSKRKVTLRGHIRTIQPLILRSLSAVKQVITRGGDQLNNLMTCMIAALDYVERRHQHRLGAKHMVEPATDGECHVVSFSTGKVLSPAPAICPTLPAAKSATRDLPAFPAITVA